MLRYPATIAYESHHAISSNRKKTLFKTAVIWSTLTAGTEHLVHWIHLAIRRSEDMTIKSRDDVPQDVRDKVDRLIDRLRNSRSKELMWRQALTETDREWVDKHITQEDWDKKNAIALFAQIRLVEPIVAALDLGVCCGHLEQCVYDALRRDIGIDVIEYEVDFRRAILEADLVLDEYRRLAVWKTQEIPSDFDNDDKLWNYFFKLARAATGGQSICPQDFSASVQPKDLNQWKYRLTKPDGFPVELRDGIVVRNGRHGLQLPSSRIRVFPIKQPVALG